MKILVADDEHHVLDVVSQVLTTAGHQVVTAVDGEEALRRVYETHPDLILLDIRMPKRDGASVAQDLRDDPTHRDIPIVFLTGLIRPSEVGRHGERHRDDLFLAKPFDANDLLRIVNLATHQAGPPPD